MLFNSVSFAIFFIIVYELYLIFNHKWQNRMLLFASYVFYGAWDWRFLFLIFISTCIDYICGLKIYGCQNIRRKKIFLFISVFCNLSILGFFKYFNFFAGSLQSLLANLGIPVQWHFLNIILPVGISFYTFQTMSYTIDIYRKEIPPTKKFFDFALFVAFFPQLVAGPIERAKRLLPQILSPRKFRLDYVYEGFYLILWGLFLKVFIADNLAKIVDPIFLGPPYEGAKVLIALYAFAFQIFCDFAGYSNIARGLGRLMGFDIMVNFRLPYFATNPREFWQRWHISLSSWLRDYLYIPLGGNKKGNIITYRNLAIVMLLGGLWHGAAWTFIVWGAYHGLLLIIHRVIQPLFRKVSLLGNGIAARVWVGVKVICFFHLICFGWIFFRADSLSQAYSIIASLFFSFQSLFKAEIVNEFIKLLFFSGVLLLVQIFQHAKKDLFVIFKFRPALQMALYLIMIYSILLFGVTTNEEFIYFQF